MRTRQLLGTLAALTLLLTACGGDDGDESGSDSGDTGQDSESPAVTVDQDDLDVGEDAFDSVVPDECEFLFDLSTSIGLAATGQVDAGEFSAEEAPEEVRGDVEVMVEAFNAYDPTDPSTAQVFASGEFEQASDNISAFVEANCDLDGGN
jgi:hypothetical protein